MSPILSPPLLGRIVDQGRNCPVGFPAALFILAIEDDADDVMHFPHPYNKCANEVESSFLAASARHFVLSNCIWARNFGYGAEEEVRTIGEPVDLRHVNHELVIDGR
jgi:hypothetical protein